MDALDNPLWASLTTLHRHLARTGPDVLRYPRDVAPFLAVPAAGVPLADDTLADLVEPDETIFLIGPIPSVPAGWQLENLGPIVQMICSEPQPPCDGPPIELLGDVDRPAVLALAALVYPHYFRARTMELGCYVGIAGDGRLDAMLGERMGFPGFREISAVCTHPDRVGRGLARQLLVHESNDLFAGGTTPFLHLGRQNTRARRLYEQNGYRVRTEIAFTALRRAQR